MNTSQIQQAIKDLINYTEDALMLIDNKILSDIFNCQTSQLWKIYSALDKYKKED